MNSKPKTSAHVVLGLDKEQKSRAALIHPNDLEAATKAAVSMGFKIGRADSPQALQMAKQLPDAKVFVSGKGLVPLVRKDIYEWLSKGLTLIDAKAESPSKDGDKADVAPSSLAEAGPKNDATANSSTGTKEARASTKPDATPWDKLGVGSVVIAPEKKPADDGFWPAVVVAISKDGQHLTLRWRDYPKLAPFTIKRHAIAIPVAPNKPARS